MWRLYDLLKVLFNTFCDVLQSGVKTLWFELQKKNSTFLRDVRLGKNGLRD